MQRKAFLIAVVGTAAVLVASAIAFASGGELSKPETIRVNQTGGKITFLPLNPSKKTFVGDMVVVNGPVFGTEGSKVGSQHAVCTLMDKKGVVGECSITTFLKAGSIAVRGPVTSASTTERGARSLAGPASIATRAAKSCSSTRRATPKDSSSS